MSIGGYIREQRMARAREMIETGKYSMLSISLLSTISIPSTLVLPLKKSTASFLPTICHVPAKTPYSHILFR